MKHQHIFTISILVCILLLSIMIAIGSTSTALKTRKSTFTFSHDEPLPTSASYYVKGVIHSDKIKVHLEDVNIHKPGFYKAYIKQANRRYDFTIHITQ